MTLLRRRESPKLYALSAEDRKALSSRVVRSERGVVTVSLPDHEPPVAAATVPETRESIQIQATLARIGAEMGSEIWIPR